MRFSSSFPRIAGRSVLPALLLCSAAWGQDRFDAAPIAYSTATPNNSVSALQTAMAEGTSKLDRDPQFGYLKALLDALKIPVESQVLVFSKTSLQQRYIAPTSPRALYFNDDTYVGTVPQGDLIEISTADAGLGAVFYALPQAPADNAAIVREREECLQCHSGSLTNGYPGHLFRSVYPDAQGYPILKAGSHRTTQDSPFKQRWGGWYVTGTHGALRHMGNAIAMPTEQDAALDLEAGANRVELDARVPRENYLTAHSDIVALMVLIHQVQVHNLITQAGFDTRLALWDQAVMDEMLKTPNSPPSDSTRRRIARAGDKLIDGLLFVGEATFDASIAGTSGFTEAFSARGPRDSQGRSLRDFDLQHRLFAYPLSYLIYSQQFDGLPEEMKIYVYRRLWDILTGVDKSARYDHLSTAQRDAIRRILCETKAGLPLYWKAE